MSDGLIVRLIPLVPAMLTTPANADAAFPVGNLAGPQPKTVWRTTSALDNYVRIDLGQDTDFDTLGLLFTNVTAAATMSIAATTDADGLSAIGSPASLISPSSVSSARASSSSRATRFHCLRTVGPRRFRYIQFHLADAGNAEGVTRAGIVAVGQSWLHGYNFELGSGRKITDLSDKRQLPGGEVGRWRKAKVPSFRATWSGMSDAERRGLWSILQEVGESEPLLVIEDPGDAYGLQENIHYCTIDQIDFYDRIQDDKSSIQLTFTDWL